MDYLTSPNHENARRVMAALERLDVELNITESGNVVAAFFKHGLPGKTKSSYGVAVNADDTDIILSVDDVSTLRGLSLEQRIRFLNEFNDLVSDDFVCTGTIFFDDDEDPQLRYYIDKNDHALQERIDECVRRISAYIPDIIRAANGNAPVSILELEGEAPFPDPASVAIPTVTDNDVAEERSYIEEAPVVESRKKKGGLFGRLFSK